MQTLPFMGISCKRMLSCGMTVLSISLAGVLASVVTTAYLKGNGLDGRHTDMTREMDRRLTEGEIRGLTDVCLHDAMTRLARRDGDSRARVRHLLEAAPDCVRNETWRVPFNDGLAATTSPQSAR